MKVTRFIYILSMLLLLWSCSDNDDSKLFSANGEEFIRFFLLVDNNENVLEFPEIDGRLEAVSNYEKKDFRVLKIPVSVSSTNITESITATFSSNVTGDIDLTISPANTLNFGPDKLVDTIFVQINNRYDFTQTQQLKLALTNVSDPAINIGIPNSLETNTEVVVDFVEPELLEYSLASNRIEISGETMQEINFQVNFPKGFLLSELNDEAFFAFAKQFDFELSRKKLAENRSFITYGINLNENINIDSEYYESIIRLKNTENFTVAGTRLLQIVKPIKIERDVEVNIASFFYNLDDPFYRTYGETWNDFNGDGICQWNSYNAFTYPVVVDSTHANAILYDDFGNEDKSDDIYHDAFRVGFRTPNANTTTTNSFNLKRWFENESTSGLNSPGFDINPALEFYPESGTSNTNGTVLIIPQFITIAGRNENSYVFAISGEGTYEEISPGIYELKFQVSLSNDELFGGTITADYRMYNTNSYADPEDLTTANCVTQYTL